MANRVAFLPVAVSLLFLASPPATAAPAAAAARTLDLPDEKPVEVARSGSHFLLTYRSGFGPADGCFVVLDRDGKEVYRRYPARDIPDHARQFAFEGGLTASGRLLVTANDGTEAALLVYDIGSPAAGPVKVWRASNTICANSPVGADGWFWCLGGEAAEANRGDDFRVLHRFAADGAVTGSWLPVSSLRAELEGRSLQPSYAGLGGSPFGSTAIAVHASGVRVYLSSIGAVHAWDGDMQSMGSVTVPRTFDGRMVWSVLPLGGGGVVAFAGADGSGNTAPLLALASGGDVIGTWVATELELPGDARLLAEDGDQLVVWERRARRIAWYPWRGSGRELRK
jgi:hypothetical protein